MKSKTAAAEDNKQQMCFVI